MRLRFWFAHMNLIDGRRIPYFRLNSAGDILWNGRIGVIRLYGIISHWRSWQWKHQSCAAFRQSGLRWKFDHYGITVDLDILNSPVTIGCLVCDPDKVILTYWTGPDFFLGKNGISCPRFVSRRMKRFCDHSNCGSDDLIEQKSNEEDESKAK